jgi:hypothetical protein
MRSTIRLIAAVALGLPALAQAGPADYVITPGVEYGEREIDMKYGTEKLANGEGRESAGSIGFGYGATPWWFTEAYLKAHKLPGDKTRYDAFEWENKFQLTETGKYFGDLGLLIELEVPKEHREEGYEVAFGPLLQWDTGPLTWNANLLFERKFHGHSDEPRVTEMLYQFQVKYRGNHAVDFGLQAFGEMGEWNHWAPASQQEHLAGPALFGKFKLGGREAIKWNAAWLAGLNKGSPDNRFRLQAEYEF